MRILYIELVLFIKFIKVITKVLERKIINQRELFPLRLIIRDKINKILIFLVVLTIIGVVMFLVCFPSEKWNDEDYFMGIAQMVGGLFTVIGVYFTIKEEEKMRKIDDKNTDNKIKEQLRLENLPVLKFSCDNEEKSCGGIVYHVDCETSDDNYKVQLNIEIKNVGLGSAQNIWFQKIIGIENDDSKSGIENQIIEPKETINYTMYFEFPKNDTEFYKRLTILVFYDDLLDNKYMQKLEGSLSISCCESDGICQYNPNAFVSVNEKYVKIGTDFKYEIPQEIIEDEISRIEYQEKQKKIIETIPEKSNIDEIVGEYLKNQENFFELCSNFFKSIDFQGCSGGINNYKLIRKNVYDVTIVDEMGVSRKEYIKCETILRVNIKTEEIRYIDKRVVKSTLNIKKRKLNKFKKQIKKEVEKIKEFEAKIYM